MELEELIKSFPAIKSVNKLNSKGLYLVLINCDDFPKEVTIKVMKKINEEFIRNNIKAIFIPSNLADIREMPKEVLNRLIEELIRVRDGE